MELVPRHYCSGCGVELGYIQVTQMCHLLPTLVKGGAVCPPHVQVRRVTPRRRREPPPGPDLNKLLGLKPKPKDRPRSQGILSTVDCERGLVADRSMRRGGAPRPGGDTRRGTGGGA